MAKDGQWRVDTLPADPSLVESLNAYAAEHGLSGDRVRDEVATYLAEMTASHSGRAMRSWNRFGSWLMRGYDVLVDEDEILRLRRLDREHPLALVFSHRSYLDGWVLPHVLEVRRFSPTFTFGGANLDLPVIGSLVRQTGVIFIRRETKDLPLYRLALRNYIAALVRRRSNVAWSIEGGRTRTGKLRPPAHGILRYLAAAAEASTGPDVAVVPVSIVYDQLHEVAGMTAEARGRTKRPEDLSWLVAFARSQRTRLGRAYVSVGSPLFLRERMTQLRAEGCDTAQAVERVALDVSHRINRATPVTVTAIVSLALLGADRALSFDRVLDTVAPLARYITARGWPVAGAASLTDRSTIRRALQELTASGVLTCFDAGTEPVWVIAPEQHLVAAFYRNTTIHILVGRAIGELALLAADGASDDAQARSIAWDEALRLRDLLKFEFFFPSRRDFRDELLAELALLWPGETPDLSGRSGRALLAQARPHLAHLVLRPFLDAYLVVADRLAAAGDAPVDADWLLDEALNVGRQWELERRIASAESVSLELFGTALRVAEHRGLISAEPAGEGADPASGLALRRQAFADEIRQAVTRLQVIAWLARQAGEFHGGQA
ncbi:MAG TPA: lysophospholipid acyltransferase [Dermatophilaceae bacterium]|nr:lysophospholipid acyltransferase [Dermatophilaceae bacterium]